MQESIIMRVVFVLTEPWIVDEIVPLVSFNKTIVRLLLHRTYRPVLAAPFLKGSTVRDFDEIEIRV